VVLAMITAPSPLDRCECGVFISSRACCGVR
jgi:hypothetical protein